MARSNKGHAEEQHRLKEIRSGLIVASKSRKPTTCSHIQASSEELYKGTQNEEGAAKNTSATPVRHIGLDHFRCRIVSETVNAWRESQSITSVTLIRVSATPNRVYGQRIRFTSLLTMLVHLQLWTANFMLIR